MEQKQLEAKTSFDQYPLDFRSLLVLFIVGALSGALGWLLYLGIANYFVEPVFCRSAETFAICRNGGAIAWVVAEVMVLAAAVAAMAKLAVYRPLLVVLAVFVSLWGLYAWLGSMSWYSGMLWHTVLFAIAFAVFGWMARANSFLIAVLASVVVMIMARLILTFA
jgi:hypothetical protein